MLGPIDVRPLPVPHDCADGFLGAYWRRPHAYLDAGVRGAISTFSKLGPIDGATGAPGAVTSTTAPGRSGTATCWHRTELDLGYRLIVAGAGRR